MDYNFREIEKKWQKAWVDNRTYKVVEDTTKQKYYVLNMFPYRFRCRAPRGSSPWLYCLRYLCALQAAEAGSTFSTLWATMPTDCLPSSMP